MRLVQESNKEGGLIKGLAMSLGCATLLMANFPLVIYQEQCRRRTHVMVVERKVEYKEVIGPLPPQAMIAQDYWVGRVNDGMVVRRTIIPFQTSWYDNDNDGKVDRKEQGCARPWGGQVARGYPEVTSKDQDLFERVVAQAIRENKIN